MFASMKTLVIATRNAHKVEEIRAILGNAFTYRTIGEFGGAPTTVEDAVTFAGNATKKAVELAQWLSTQTRLARGTEAFVLADDSGLEVDALNGAPGVHSARFAALDTGLPGNSPDAENSAKLLRLIEGVPMEQRTARFRCVLALTPVLPEPAEPASPVCLNTDVELQTQIFQGTCEGRIEFAPRGQGGFGYDPLFVPQGFDQTFAELGEDIKNRLSHRAKALAELRRHLGSTGFLD
jgi:XTP/dITP diphosphohydrolase